jgi:hypothetical protein
MHLCQATGSHTFRALCGHTNNEDQKMSTWRSGRRLPPLRTHNFLIARPSPTC